MNNKIRLFGWITLIVVPILNIQPVYAKMFKCVDSNRSVFYNDKPCPVSDKETLIKADKAPKNGYIPPALVRAESEIKKDMAVAGVAKGQQDLVRKKNKSNLEGAPSGGGGGSSIENKNVSNENKAGGSTSSVSKRVQKRRTSSKSNLAIIPLKIESSDR